MNSEFGMMKRKNSIAASRAESALLSPIFRALFLLASVSWLFTPAFAATHVTGVYSVGADPAVMATVNGNSEYGLVFAQRNKSVTYNNVLYVNNVVTAYFDANGNLNDGAGNQWIDLIPDANATPGDSYYVVTINIQGAVHSEIWIVPDQAGVSVLSVRQTEAPPSGGAATPTFFYQTIQQSGAALTQRPTLNLTGAGVSCLDNSGSQRTDCTITGGGGGGSGTVTNFSAGGLGPLFTSSVATPTTTPALSFTLSNASAHSFLGNNTGATSAPAYVQPACGDLSNAAASCSTDTTNAANISSGTLSSARLPAPTAGTLGGVKSFNPVPSIWLTGISLQGTPTSSQPACGDLSNSSGGCTMSTTAGGDLSGTLPGPTVAKVNGTSVPTNSAADQTIVTTASATGAWKAINNCGDSTHALSYSTGTHAFGCQAITAGPGAGGSPGQVQWNNSSALAGMTNLTTTGTVTTAIAGVDWLFADPTDTTKLLSFDLSGQSSAVTGKIATSFTSAKTWTIPNATDTSVGRATTDTLTNKTLDAEGAGNVITQPSKVWFVAASCNNAAAAPGFDLPTTNAPTPTCQGTNIRTASLDYADSAVQKAYFNFKLPADWTGNIDAKIKWFSTATTNATKWQIATGCLTDGTTDATAGPTLNAAQSVTDNDSGTAKAPVDSSITSLTTTGCAAGRIMYFELSRDNSDTNTATASVLGVDLTIRRAL